MSSGKTSFLAITLSVLTLVAPRASATEALELGLGDALRKARERNPTLQRQLLEQVRKEEEVSEARGALLPTVDARAYHLRHSMNFQAMGMDTAKFGMSSPVVGPFSLRSYGAEAQMPLLDLSLWRRWRGSQAQLAGSQAESQKMQEEISALVVGQYLLALRSEALVRSVKARIELAKALEELAIHQEQSGVGTGLDTLRAKVRTQTEQQALVRAQSASQEALSGLVRLLDLPAESQLQIKPLSPSTSPSEQSLGQDYQSALTSRADFRILQAQTQAADERLAGVKSQHLPTVQAFASLEKMGLIGNEIVPDPKLEKVYEVGVRIKVPIFSGGRTQSQVNQAKAARSQVEASRRELEARVAFELRTAREHLGAARSEVALTEEGLRLAKAELEQARHRFEAGVSNNIELVSAQEELAKAEENDLDARYRLDQAQADLAHAKGELESRYAN